MSLQPTLYALLTVYCQSLARLNSQHCSWLGRLHRQRSWRSHPCIRRTVSRCFTAFRLHRHLRCHVTNDCFRFLVVSFVHSRLDIWQYFVFVGLPAYLQRRSPYSTPQLVWYSDLFVATTTCLTPSRYCISLAASAGSRNRSTLNWRFGLWHTECWTALAPPSVVHNSFRYLAYTRSSPFAVVVHAAAARSAVPSATRAIDGRLTTAGCWAGRRSSRSIHF